MPQQEMSSEGQENIYGEYHSQDLPDQGQKVYPPPPDYHDVIRQVEIFFLYLLSAVLFCGRLGQFLEQNSLYINPHVHYNGTTAISRIRHTVK